MATGITNQSILQTDLQGYPATFNDVLRKDPGRKGFWGLVDKIKILPDGWSNSVSLSLMVHSIQWHPALPKCDSLAIPVHDVYLVTVPHLGWPTSLRHWSLYSQGCFFHLVLQEDRPCLQLDRFSEEELKEELEDIQWHARCDSIHLWNDFNGRYTPMIAYHLGQTRFDSTQIESLARFVSSQFTKYTPNRMNCHLFAMSLANRVIMTNSGGTVFVGTRAQIIHWDTSHGEQPPPFSLETGYLLRAPNRGKSEEPHDKVLNI
ncbi:uncharacterized protein PG986_002144 [Apiospora aurea]|uniref:Uncharacterized protein n=1 Tax=Apiospora aurea TaxID=335848 RepID=A0ABR1QYU3_9PEZI